MEVDRRQALPRIVSNFYLLHVRYLAAAAAAQAVGDQQPKTDACLILGSAEIG
ncbi:hypothetical protein JMJ56_30790 [Belnapia sp. T18]|uniref:Uncharacterized protein n=1 Tax=Belnapia arida TaxID=2804533 RepID=A0ABS1UDY1_9PROT|nr:hypothetical protein [Belnapia arida]MBL6082360.1 hypothetical protein [Belnapia arida]